MDVGDPRPGAALPNLAAMGANPNAKDVFVEIGYMQTTAQTERHTATC